LNQKVLGYYYIFFNNGVNRFVLNTSEVGTAESNTILKETEELMEELLSSIKFN